MTRLLLYGATGYTGRLIARAARAYGIEPILAGRSADAVAALASEHGLEHRAFSLDDQQAIRTNLTGVTAVLHCAGPFMHTAAAMASACIAQGVHYLDITGEIAVFEALAQRSAEASAAGVMLLPGTGYDVVPTDCLAALLKERLPDATRLRLAIGGTGRLSRGTQSTMVENAGGGGAIRSDGRIVRVPTAWRTIDVDFGGGPQKAVTIPWGDVSTAWHSTGIPNIEVYAAVPPAVIRLMKISRNFEWLLRRSAVKRFQLGRIRAGAPGPSERELTEGVSYFWGWAQAPSGKIVHAVQRGPNGYAMTAHTALLIAQRVLAGDLKPGFQTPARAYGPDLILSVPGVTRDVRG